MVLMNVIEDQTMAVSGFERRTFMCSKCCDIESRLAFNKHSGERESETTPVLTSPTIAPASAIQNKQSAEPGLFSRAVAKIRNIQRSRRASHALTNATAGKH
jgi:hypothetical protein